MNHRGSLRSRVSCHDSERPQLVMIKRIRENKNRPRFPPIVDSTWFVPPPSREKIWREKLFLGLVQNESKAHRLISICTKPRKSFYHQFFALDKPSGIDNTEIHISFLGKECVFRGSFLRHAARRTPPLVVRRGAMASATRVHAPCLPCSTPQRAVSARSSRAISQRAVSARREPSAREATEAQPNVQRVTRETPRTGRPSCAK